MRFSIITLHLVYVLAVYYEVKLILNSFKPPFYFYGTFYLNTLEVSYVINLHNIIVRPEGSTAPEIR
jgi:hypothetical protein